MRTTATPTPPPASGEAVDLATVKSCLDAAAAHELRGNAYVGYDLPAGDVPRTPNGPPLARCLRG
jgi:hypothetical protein